MRDGFSAWMVTIGITLFAFFIRAVGLAFPNKLMFDETYYAKDGWTLINHGHELDWVEGANEQIVAGNIDQVTDTASFVVHPPLGKILIGLGELLFGMNSMGWRFAALVAGTMLVFLVIRLARRLARSTLVGALAGILLTFDGLAFVMSRIALLDIFQAVFAVAAVAALVADRDWMRHKLADHLRSTGERDLGGRFGPLLLWRPWRFVAGVMFGASCAVKWNSVFLVAVFGIVTVVWDVGARRLA
ncbi:MAG: phospholipid carrier-dependent glycosyltransferase, partial [Propionibacterium sp.]|nr:phospholipid carrier-dependent glycosyltransferase [Propionibacterium sp.]